MKERNLLILSGPTAVGKTALSVAVARALGSEIISADALQIYRGLDIGTAKVTATEMEGVVHHLIDHVSPEERYTVADYRRDALALIDRLNAEGKIPIVTGGTGLYLNAILYDMDFGEVDDDPAYRAQMTAFLEREGREALHDQLRQVDPEAAAKIHPNNAKRVLRALEIHHMGGEKRDFRRDPQPTPGLNPLLIGLTRDRKVLYDRINARVHQMIESGLIDEVKRIKSSGLDDTSPALKGIGYKEVITYLEGGYDLDEMIATLQKNSRRYAKRQLTWLRRYPDIHWLDLDRFDDTEEAVEQILALVSSTFA